jgi:hypothetical protein
LAAATLPQIAMPPNIFTTPTILSSNPLNQAKTGVGVTSIKPLFEKMGA